MVYGNLYFYHHIRAGGAVDVLEKNLPIIIILLF